MSGLTVRQLREAFAAFAADADDLPVTVSVETGDGIVDEFVVTGGPTFLVVDWGDGPVTDRSHVALDSNAYWHPEPPAR